MAVNILFASHTADLKGSAISLCQLMEGLDRGRYNPVAAFWKDGPLVARLKGRGVEVRVLTSRGLLGLCRIREALKVLREERIRLVHLNSAVPFCKYIGIAAKLRGTPVIWHVREDPQGKRVRMHKRWVRLLSDRIVVVSSDLEAVFRDTGKAVKIYNGVDTDKFIPGIDGGAFRDSFGIPKGAFVFGMVGSVEPRKGNLKFLKAAETLLREGADACFVVVGSGLPGDVEELREFLKGRPALSNRAVLTGRLEDVPGVMAGIDALVMPSKWEGFPRSLIEAMAAGVPAVATDVGEVGSMVEDGVTGFVIPNDDIGALTEAMKKCLGMGESLKEMGRRAREKAVKEFTVAMHVERVQGEYKRLIGV